MIARRGVLRAAALAASATLPWPLAAKPSPNNGDSRPLAALLLPLTGPGADLSRSLHHAADLAQPPTKETKIPLLVFDTGASPDGAAAAATLAVKRGAPLIVGPLYGPQVAAAVQAAGGVPVVTPANDVAAGTNAFVLGITPRQAVGAILAYARSRGVRRVAIDAGSSRWDAAARLAAEGSARDLGLTLVGLGANATPDAVLVPGDADALTGAARRLDGSGVQLLGTYQGLALTGAGMGAVDGAWLAAPDPDGFGDFARRFEAAFGNPPGVVAGLTYDAVRIAAMLRSQGHLDRDGLTGSAGFPGVTGAVRFAADGHATRELAILVASGGAFRTVAHSQAA